MGLQPWNMRISEICNSVWVERQCKGGAAADIIDALVWQAVHEVEVDPLDHIERLDASDRLLNVSCEILNAEACPADANLCEHASELPDYKARVKLDGMLAVSCDLKDIIDGRERLANP